MFGIKAVVERERDRSEDPVWTPRDAVHEPIERAIAKEQSEVLGDWLRGGEPAHREVRNASKR